MVEKSEQTHKWTFLTNHAHVIVCLSINPAMRMRDIADRVGITERAVQKIIADLTHEGYLEIDRRGRCNSYRLNSALHLRHPIESGHTIGELLLLLLKGAAEIHSIQTKPGLNPESDKQD